MEFIAMVLLRELQGLGCQGSYSAVARYVSPWREERRREEEATVRFETGPGEQAQVDWGSSWVWLGEERVRVHLFKEGPFRFFFCSREKPRSHVHVVCADGEAKYWIEPDVELARNYGPSHRDLGRIEQIIHSRREEILNAWQRHFGGRGHEHLGRRLFFWVLLDDREVFLPFDEFPRFRDAPIGAILNVERPQPHHLYWPRLDVDLSVESIEHPEQFPLRARGAG